MAGANACIRRIGAITCSSHCSCQSSSVSSSSVRVPVVPALFTSAQGGSGHAASSRSPASGAVTSSSMSAPLRATVSTRAPSSASMRAVAAPIPRRAARDHADPAFEPQIHDGMIAE